MSKGATYKNDLLLLMFNSITVADLARQGLSGITFLTVALHTGDPASSQATNEIAYTGYARQLVSRTAAGWVVAGGSVSPAAPISFPRMTGGAGGSVTFWSVGTGTGNYLMYRGAVAPAIVVVVDVIPVIGSGSTITEA
jgi:hypothetical protein